MMKVNNVDVANIFQWALSQLVLTRHVDLEQK